MLCSMVDGDQQPLKPRAADLEVLDPVLSVEPPVGSHCPVSKIAQPWILMHESLHVLSKRADQWPLRTEQNPSGIDDVDGARTKHDRKGAMTDYIVVIWVILDLAHLHDSKPSRCFGQYSPPESPCLLTTNVTVCQILLPERDNIHQAYFALHRKCVHPHPCPKLAWRQPLTLRLRLAMEVQEPDD
jgi:hypothetical protein